VIQKGFIDGIDGVGGLIVGGSIEEESVVDGFELYSFWTRGKDPTSLWMPAPFWSARLGIIVQKSGIKVKVRSSISAAVEVNRDTDRNGVSSAKQRQGST
jgi:hypothetical protein